MLTPYLIAFYLYETVFLKYAGERVVGRLGTLPLGDLALLIANRGLSMVAWMSCIWVLYRLLDTSRTAIYDRARLPTR